LIGLSLAGSRITDTARAPLVFFLILSMFVSVLFSASCLALASRALRSSVAA
jgi:hypothetical protein